MCELYAKETKATSTNEEKNQIETEMEGATELMTTGQVEVRRERERERERESERERKREREKEIKRDILNFPTRVSRLMASK